MSPQTHLEWAATIPDGWRVVRLKYVCQFTTGWTPPTGDNAAYVGDNLWANISDIGPRVVSDTAKRLSDDAVKRHSIALSPKGSLLFSFKLSIGHVSFAGEDMFTNEAIATFLPNDALDLNFAYYAFPEMIVRNASENIYGAKMLNQQLINSAPLVLPPRPEQISIAAFLDRETGKIDALVEEQKRLIELLKEKRQAVISHAVTRGLDPKVRMKPSGVEWLGDVPVHWEVSRLKHIIQNGTSISYGIVQPGEPQDVGVPFIQTTNMSSGKFALEQLQLTTPEIAAQYPRSTLTGGEVVLGIRASIGAAHIIPSSLAGANLSRGVARIVCGRSVLNEFLVMWLRADCTGQYWAFSKQGSTFNEVSIETVRELPIAIPPHLEQLEIARDLNRHVEKFNKLIDTAEMGIRLLIERRDATIASAVTGKIDVRNFSTHEAAA